MAAHSFARVLLVADERSQFEALAALLDGAGYPVETVRGIGTACAWLRRRQVPVVVADLAGPGTDALALLRATKRGSPPSRVIFRFANLDGPSTAALPAISGDAFDCLGEAADAGALLRSIRSALEPSGGGEVPGRVASPSPAPVERRSEAWPDVLLSALQTALALHDPGTGEHSARVASLAQDLALEMGYAAGSAELADLRRGALMHDVGKIGVSRAILRKAGPLSDEEWGEIRRHPEYGYRILRDVSSLQEAAEMIRASHERWDGGGYPRGLAGESIPRGARIFALADAWDAMTSDRPYRRAMRTQDALEELRKHAGTQFDPRGAEAFERLLARRGEGGQRDAAA